MEAQTLADFSTQYSDTPEQQSSKSELITASLL